MNDQPHWGVVLASASPARKRLLQAAGIAPTTVISGVDEDAVVAGLSDRSPTASCLALARSKAAAVAPELAGQSVVIIGADSILDVDGQSFGKPATSEIARSRLVFLAGRSAWLRTGHCVIRASDGAANSEVVTTKVRFGKWSPAELDWYLTSGESQTVAGGFTLDGLSAPFMAGVQGDPGNVIGLSLPCIRRQLQALGITWPQLHSQPSVK